MQVAVCDDEPQEREYIETLLKQCAPEISIESFSSAEALVNAAKSKVFSLIYLDIEMENPNELNGFEAAEELMSKDVKPLIVFVTKSMAYTVRGYDVAFHYLVKPICEDKFREIFEKAMRIVTPQYFSFSAEGELHRVPLADILYFESRNYLLIIHTRTGAYQTRRSLKSIETELQSASFFRIHASFLVNLHHVVRISKTDVELRGGTLLKISRGKKRAFDLAFTAFARENI